MTGARFAFFLALPAALGAQSAGFSFDDAQRFLKSHCQACHQGSAPAGGFALSHVATAETMRTQPERWNRLALRVRHGEMPPKAAPAPAVEEREKFLAWADSSLRAAVCSAGSIAEPHAHPASQSRRVLGHDSRSAGHPDRPRPASCPPTAPAAKASTTPPRRCSCRRSTPRSISTRRSSRSTRPSRNSNPAAKILVARPGDGVSPDQAAQAILKPFLSRAFRRPATEADLGEYLDLYRAARRQGQAFEPSIIFAIRARAGVSAISVPLRAAEPDSGAPRVDSYAMASRLSYFLWGSMPDELLFDRAAEGKLQEPEVLKQLIPRNAAQRDSRSKFVERFVEQWLRTRSLENDKAPDQQLFPGVLPTRRFARTSAISPRCSSARSGLRDLSLLNLIDSDHTILTTQAHAAISTSGSRSERRSTAAAMAGAARGFDTAADCSAWRRCWPSRRIRIARVRCCAARGSWIRCWARRPRLRRRTCRRSRSRRPADAPKTVRERLAQHREDPVCASCHARIDPLGFALENYDRIGRWRTEGRRQADRQPRRTARWHKFDGPAELKNALLERKDVFVRNLTAKMLGYALGRGLDAAGFLHGGPHRGECEGQ